jgi:hypothetical protein
VLAFFEQPDVQDALSSLAAEPELTVLVGAGASKEVGLPTWSELVDALANRAVGSKRSWSAFTDQLRHQIADGDLLAAAERVEVVLGQARLRQEIERLLYGQDDPADLEPGPLADGVAAMKLAWGEGLRVATTNYDQLLLTALRRRGAEAHSYCVNSRRPGVIHLHGVLGYEGPADGRNIIVLTQRDYLAPVAAGWRADFMEEALAKPCLFVGASLDDLNMLRPLYGQRRSGGAPLHRALFVRPPATSGFDRLARLAWEDVERQRWRGLSLQPLYCDNYADVAQFAFELAALRVDRSLPPLAARFQAWYDRAAMGVLSEGRAQYRSNQLRLSDLLAELLSGLQAELGAQGEVMSLGICALLPPHRPAGQERPVNWVASDRAMTTPATIEPLALDAGSQWTAVKAMCAGVGRAEEKHVYASRWRYVWAEPIFTSSSERIPVGAAVLSTRAPAGVTLLPSRDAEGRLDPANSARVRDALKRAGEAVLLAEP